MDPLAGRARASEESTCLGPLGRGNAAFVADAEGRIAGWNPEAERLTSLRRAEVLGRPCSEVLRCQDAFGKCLGAPTCPLRLASNSAGVPLGFELQASPGGGEPVQLRASAVAVADPPGGCLVLLQPSPAGVFGRPDPGGAGSATLEAALDRMIRMIGADAAELFLQVPVGKELVLACHCGAAARAFRERLSFKEGEGFPGIVAETGWPLMSTDLSSDSRFLRKEVPRKGIMSCLSVPVVGTRFMGTLEVAFRSAYRSPASVMPFVSDVARDLAFHLERGRMRVAEDFDAESLEVRGEGNQVAGTAERLLAALMRESGADGGVLLAVTAPDGKLGMAAASGAGSAVRRKLAGGIGPASCPAFCRGARASCGASEATDTDCCRSAAKEFRAALCLPVAEDDPADTGKRPIATALLGFSRGVVLPTARLTFLHEVIRRGAMALRTAARADEASAAASAAALGVAERLIASGLDAVGGEGLLDIRCLGRFQLSRSGRVVTPEAFKRRRSLVLLKILLTRYGRPVHREELMELLWPEKHPEESRKLLNSTIHYLRGTLGHEGDQGQRYVARDGEFYAFDLGSEHRLDTVAFEEAAKEGDRLQARGDRHSAIASYRRAIDLYRGDFLEEERWSDWCALERAYFREKYLAVLCAATDLHAGLGDLSAAEASCRIALQIDPVHEDIHRKLMEILWRAGRRAEALRQFDECRATLGRELGIEPTSQTWALARSLGDSEPPG